MFGSRFSVPVVTALARDAVCLCNPGIRGLMDHMISWRDWQLSHKGFEAVIIEVFAVAYLVQIFFVVPYDRQCARKDRRDYRLNFGHSVFRKLAPPFSSQAVRW